MRPETHEERARRERRTAVLDAAAAVALVAVGLTAASAVVLQGRGVDLGVYSSYTNRFDTTVLGAFVQGAGVALLATVAAFAAGMGIGFVTGWERAAVRPALRAELRGLGPRKRAVRTARVALLYAGRRTADFYVELVRGTPIVVQMFFFWEVALVTAPRDWSPQAVYFLAGAAAMAFNTGGYQSEIFRAGIAAVPAGQLEAARAVGFGRLGGMRHVILPQALRLVIPPLTNEFVNLFKVSSLLTFIGVVEITNVAKTLTFSTSRAFELFLLTTALYLVVTVPVSRSSSYLERRLRIPGLGAAAKDRTARRNRGSPRI